VKPVRTAFFDSVLQLSALGHIDSVLVFLGQSQMPHIGF
jgi:hypothetical protein